MAPFINSLRPCYLIANVSSILTPKLMFPGCLPEASVRGSRWCASYLHHAVPVKSRDVSAAKARARTEAGHERHLPPPPPVDKRLLVVLQRVLVILQVSRGPGAHALAAGGARRDLELAALAPRGLLAVRTCVSVCLTKSASRLDPALSTDLGEPVQEPVVRRASAGGYFYAEGGRGRASHRDSLPG